MGISGLLPLLRSIHKHCTLKTFAGQTIGIDAYGWLHRGTVACAVELALDKPTTKYIEFAMSRVRMLLDFGVTPYLVFDGDNLPSKAGTNKERRKRRDESKILGLQLYKAGKVSQAHQELQKSVDVTPHMARLLIEELKKLNVQYIVAPYEADAQLAYLERKGIINGILSEDSDLLVYGAKCLLTKLNQFGECVEINRSDFSSCKDVSLTGWSDAMFRRMAILSGCDYLDNIDKMGLKTAYRYVRKYKEAEKVLRMIQFEGKFCVPSGYLELFQHAELTFLHHRVFCPIERKMVFFNELDVGMKEENMPFLGPFVDDETAIGVACGDLHPKTKEPMLMQESSSSRPTMREYRRQTYAAVPELKPRKSIDSFFKPHRQPLAELDPNSLTPSPSQQRVLEHNRNASWEPRMVSSAPQLRRTQSSGLHTSISPTIGNGDIDRSNFLTRASTLSTYQPPKRQRLCSESEETSPSKEIKQSRFFANAIAEPSPLAQKKSKSKRSKKANFDVWSDDSIDDVLLGLPDVHQLASPEKGHSDTPSRPADSTKNTGFAQDFDLVPQSSPAQREQSPYSSAEADVPPSENSKPKSTVISCKDDPEAFEDLLEYHVRKQNESLLQTFAYQPSPKRERALKSLSPSPEQPRSLEKSFETPSDVRLTASQSTALYSGQREATKTSDSSRTFDSLSALQQAAALDSLFRGRQFGDPNGAATAVSTVTGTESGEEKAGNYAVTSSKDTQPKRAEAKTHSVEKEQVIQATIKSVVRDYDNLKNSALPPLVGSEDAMIPNSEDDTSEAEQVEPKLKLDLKAFAFIAT